jgi:protein-tyrosine phosphatase
MKILMVCLGNICRSPLAEGILKEKIRSKGLNWQVDSAGTGGWHIGSTPDRRSVEVAARYNIDITDQRARKVRSIDFSEFDIIYAMDTSNYEDLRRMAISQEELEKIRLILEEIYPGKRKSVPDPYWDDNGFEEVFSMLEKACEAIVRKYT